MSGYVKWDRAAYIERVGGPEEAEQRRAVMARQSGYRLAEERRRRGLTRPRSLRLWESLPAGSPRSNAASLPPSTR